MAKQLSDLIPNKRNPRHASDKKLEMLRKSIEKMGSLDGIIENERTGNMVGGHQRQKIADPQTDIVILEKYETPTEAGTVAYGYVMIAGERFPYRRVNWDEDTEKAAMIAANRGAGFFDLAVLSELFLELDQVNFDMDFTLFTEEEREDIVVPVTYCPPAGDPNNCPDPPKEATTKRGDIWQLGRHLLMCGNSTLINDVERLMDGKQADMVFTDPPYNIAYEGKTKNKLTIESDDMSDGDFRQFLLAVFTNFFTIMKPGAPIYVAHADTERVNFTSAFLEAGFHFSSVLIWAKQQFTFGRQDYFWKHEPILYGWQNQGAHPWYGPNNEDTVWQIDRPHKSEDHPTMKPIELMERAINNSSKQGELIVDLFGSSGSTLIACEKTGRNCNTMELDPRYCDVILRRWSEYTEMKPTLLRQG